MTTNNFSSDNFSSQRLDSQGNKFFYDKDRRLHRLDGPAIERADGQKEYWIEGENFTKEKFEARIAQSLIVRQEAEGCVLYTRKDNGKFHRLDGPAVEYSRGDYTWYQNGVIHRLDGPAIKTEYGEIWIQNGRIHREDGPAIERSNGKKEYWLEGQPITEEEFLKRKQPKTGDDMKVESIKHVSPNGNILYKNKDGYLHRLDGPAVKYTDGHKEWYKEGNLHREDGPAIEKPDGTKEWLQNGLHHRLDGPAIESGNGRREWWVKGERHREDGPAIEGSDETKQWWKNGRLHREDGPAITWASGKKEYWLNGTWITKETWEDEIVKLKQNNMQQNSTLQIKTETTKVSKMSKTTKSPGQIVSNIAATAAAGAKMAAVDKAGNILLETLKEISGNDPIVAMMIDHPIGKEALKYGTATALYALSEGTEVLPGSETISNLANGQMQYSAAKLTEVCIKLLEPHMAKLIAAGQRIEQLEQKTRIAEGVGKENEEEEEESNSSHPFKAAAAAK